MTAALTKIYIPRDTTACSLGADRVAAVIQRHIEKNHLPLEIVRNGSRGLYWLEPMLELETEQGRVACGPITPDQVDEFMAAASWRNIDKHPLYLGLTEDIDYLKRQQRLTFHRVGVIATTCLEDYFKQRGFAGLRLALDNKPQASSGLLALLGSSGRGRATRRGEWDPSPVTTSIPRRAASFFT